MRKSSLHLLIPTLFGLTTAQTSSWGEPFVVDNSALSTPTSSNNLMPITATRSGLDLATSPPTIPSVSPSVSGGTVISGIQSVLSKASFDPSGSDTRSSAGVQSTAAAKGIGGLRKMGFAGALAGAAGVLLV
ncbi:hypothetical protein T440DRAFT_449810 [Plenodomus tracheiphilus IPT5]|uniref:Uncharacterized protein n=1 Tax=Plenodomus tracheiphilus IPT5 TaxID=1408161 RepID=A0A6A7B7A5_9PLEO|nr:hypothetical protein T440DRAFT_449810 [Plenodomus tracheiphilus IPT5]